VFSAAEGSYASIFKNIRCIFHGFNTGMKEVEVNGKKVATKMETVPLVDGLKYLEAIYDPGYFKSLWNKEVRNAQQTVDFTNFSDEIRIIWR
jgi:hypothetical protein